SRRAGRPSNFSISGSRIVADEPVFVATLSKQQLRRCVISSGSHRPHRCSQLPERPARLRRECRAKNFAVFRLGRASVLGSTNLQTRYPSVIKIPQDQPGHSSTDHIDITDS
ncbi:MAG TPA: hypothetical protein VFQ82_13525, partial [Stellaceae bacterium]|nr:hypothetical protein [Stellaceae bacterium]